jgi:endonuclease G
MVAMLQSFCLATETNCPEHFAYGEAPDLVDTKLTAKSREICYSSFAIMHSGITRTPIYVAEYLTRERVEQSKGIKRHNRFHPDENIPAEERAELRDYEGSGFDRGHLAPSADMPDERAQYESFSLANMVPHDPANNRGAWAKLEALVRRLANDQGRLYVITGPIFESGTVRQIGGAVRIPDKLFKVVLISDSVSAKAFIIENGEAAGVSEIALDVLETMTGLRLFP